MARTDVAAAINARIVPTVEYGVDPRGLGFFRRLTALTQRAHRGDEGTRVLPRTEMFHGYATPLQRFTGMAVLGTAAPLTRRVSTLGDERSDQVADATSAIFADRMRRGR